ncbi:hypothetical protein [Microvirga sp. VF16]|uniref:hypothetical protein n=1 Tax=Microvirga sp. VF16 TaxID=2807101 RepID=UPI00193D955C|nr:hypothetical protein [Microvirga sp. VF16]QRM34316.1 hypothetical protein JO965_34420 [Microvirga sp. VF16]
MVHVDDICAGPIGGLYLPPMAWDLLRREKIQTIDQLMANVHRLERFDDVEPRMAQVIRQAIACTALSVAWTSGEVLLSPWCA